MDQYKFRRSGLQSVQRTIYDTPTPWLITKIHLQSFTYTENPATGYNRGVA
jgi:hypothetical protein